MDAGGGIDEDTCQQILVTRSGGSNGNCCVRLYVESAAAGIVYTLAPLQICWSDGDDGDRWAELCITNDADCIPDPDGELIIRMVSDLPGQCCNMGSDRGEWDVSDDDECTTTTTAAATTTTTADPCEAGVCTYEWICNNEMDCAGFGGSWSFVSKTGCDSPCGCTQPVGDGTTHHESRVGTCE